MSINNPLLPTSQATNAYDLLEDVIRAVEQEPKRLNMDHWYISADSELGQSLRVKPACGTVACIAGWVCLLGGAREYGSYAAMDLLGANPLTGDDEGCVDLRIALRQVFYTFPDANAILRRDDGETVPELGTPEYVAEVAQQVRDVMARYETRLRATPIDREAD